MPAHNETKTLPFAPQQLFDMVADVARYPEFLPWCKAARVSDYQTLSATEQGEARSGGGLEVKTSNQYSFLGELVINYKGLSESYTSRVTLTPHHAIDVVMEKGPFDYLTNNWRFTPEGVGTRIDFDLDFKFRSKMLEMMMGGFFLKASEKMMSAFEARAAALYGKH
jgi:coenzyme Q-binding protein COQ10